MTKEDVLQKCKVDGTVIKLPDGQLDRKLYTEVKKSLELIGGKWKGNKVMGFVFNEDPTELLEQISNGEKRNLKKEFQFFATPSQLADELVSYADIKNTHNILEPSAGQGAIIKAIQKVCPTSIIKWCELMPVNQVFLRKLSNVEIVCEDFLEYKTKNVFDRIIANPPFSKNQDIKHIYNMYDALKQGGRLVSVASKHWQNTNNKVETEFRKWLDLVKADIHEIEAGAFKESGTSIASLIIVIDK